MSFVYNILFTFPISYVCSLIFGLHHMVLHLCILYFVIPYTFTHTGLSGILLNIYFPLRLFHGILYCWLHTYPLHKMYYPFSFFIFTYLIKYALCLLRYSISFYCSFLFIYYVFCYFSLQSTYIKVSLYIFLYVKHSFITINYLCDLIFILK